MREVLPSISVVVPTYDRPEKLVRCLESLAKLDYPSDRFEVIVVDDGSPTPLDEAVAPFEARIDIQLIRQENSGPATARNRGAQAARGTYLAFTDDDCTVDSQWLQALARKFNESNKIAIGGLTQNGLPNDAFAMASHAILDLVYSFYNVDPERATFFASNNFALERVAFLELGGFSEDFPQAASEDRDLCDRWIGSGRDMSLAPEALVLHFHDMNLHRFCRQHFNYGRGAYRFHTLKLTRGAERIEIDSDFHTEAMKYPFSDKHDGPRFQLLAMMVLWQIANAAGFAYEGLQERLRRNASG